MFSHAHAADTGLDGYLHWLDHAERSAGRVNLLREGIVHAHHVTTVSPTYAKEIQTPEYGWGLDGVLRARANHLTGILNGVDYEEWDPRRDRHLPERYAANQLGAKARIKTALLQRLGLPRPAARRWSASSAGWPRRRASTCCSTRCRHCSRATTSRSSCSAAARPHTSGSSPRLRRSWPGRVAFHRGYDEELSHWIEAGSDIFLMPSQYEPCGLNQMYSLRYGTVPVVRRTGGLADSVQQFDPATRQGTGVVFNDFDVGGVTWGLRTALELYPHKALWRRLVQNGMAQDYSWRRQVGEYVALYERLAAG